MKIAGSATLICPIPPGLGVHTVASGLVITADSEKGTDEAKEMILRFLVQLNTRAGINEAATS